MRIRGRLSFLWIQGDQRIFNIFKKNHFSVIVLIFLIISCIFLPAGVISGDRLFERWVAFSRAEESSGMLKWLRCRMVEELTGRKCKGPLTIEHPNFLGRFGLFVTLKKGNSVRGCYGAFHHSSDSLEVVLVQYLRGALTGDPRYNPVDMSEINEIQIIITIADRQFPVYDINLIDISQFGINITYENNESSVYVPAEIRSIAYLKRLLKSKRVCQINGFRAVTIPFTVIRRP